MKKILCKILVVAIIFLFCLNKHIEAQSNFSARLITFSVNPFDTINNKIYTKKITQKGLFTFEPGVNISFELFGNDYTSAKISQSVRLDACSKFAGSSQILLRLKKEKKWKHSLTAGIGPILFYRKTWENIEGYTNQEYYYSNSQLQHSVMWLSAEIEYNLYLSKHADLCLTLNHLAPRSFGMLIGYKYWISRKSSHCNTCPSYR